MAPSGSESPPPQNSEIDLQPFYVLHKASSRKSERKSTPTAKTRRRIELSEDAERDQQSNDHYHLRIEAFHFVWSKINSTIKDVLRDINTNAFNEIHIWVRESFNAITSLGTPGFAEATRSFPFVTNAASKQLHTALVLTKNMEFIDDQLTFQELGQHFKSHGYHVANLSSLDFLAKNGIGGCLRSLLKQFLLTTFDAAEMSILSSWYSEQGNYNTPVVVIIDDMERCCGSVLSDFILTLSEWVVKIPIILIMGVATTLDALRTILPSNALQHLCPYKFILGSPNERMDAVVEAVLVKQCSGFSVGHKVAVLLRNYFLNQDGTLTSFIRALKIACAQHFSMEPLSFILKGLQVEDESQDEKHSLLPKVLIKNASDPLSYMRNKIVEETGETLAHGLSELKRLQKYWSTVFLCLYEVVKCDNVQLLDLLCEALDPDLYNFRVSDNHMKLNQEVGISSSSDHCMHRPYSRKSGFIFQVVRKVRDLPAALLCQLLKSWEKLTVEVFEIHDKVKELQSILKCEDGRSMKQDLTHVSRRHASRISETKVMNEKVVLLIEAIIRDYLQPIECLTLHEIVCFKNVDKLQSALIGDPRRRIQVDLLEFHKILRCSCCGKSGNILSPSMHDTSIMYSLAQEHGDLINLHDWYKSFKTIILEPGTKGKRKLKQFRSPKKGKEKNELEKKSEASIQAGFCRAVTELQITGLIRMPSKRRPDYVQRVAFGL